MYGRETGRSETPHLQGCIEFPNAKTLQQVARLIPRSHLEARKGTPEQASLYCKKQGDYVEKGDLPKQGGRSDLARAAEMVQAGGVLQVATEMPAVYVRYHRGLEALRTIGYPERTEAPIVIWLWGATGTGKTREATDCDSFYIKACDDKGWQWWNGYTQQKRIVCDEFDGCWPLRDWLRFTDRYPYQGHTKGGFVRINSPEIYITSEKPPQAFWEMTDLQQVIRRITEVRHRS